MAKVATGIVTTHISAHDARATAFRRAMPKGNSGNGRMNLNNNSHQTISLGERLKHVMNIRAFQRFVHELAHTGISGLLPCLLAVHVRSAHPIRQFHCARTTVPHNGQRPALTERNAWGNHPQQTRHLKNPWHASLCQSPFHVACVSRRTGSSASMHVNTLLSNQKTGLPGDLYDQPTSPHPHWGCLALNLSGVD